MSMGPLRRRGHSMSQQMGSPEELRAFQQELARREQSHEWGFLAYYESPVPPLCE